MTPATFSRRLGWGVCWAVLGGLLAVTVVRLSGFTGAKWAVAVVALTPWWYFPAYVIVLVALLRRRRLVAACAAVLVVVQIVLLVPVWRPWSTAPAASGVWRFRIFDANVKYDNLDLAGIAAQIKADHPQLVTLEELSYDNMQSLLRTGALDGYRYHLLDPTNDALGFGVWSTAPLRGLKLWSAGTNSEVEGTLYPPGLPAIRLLAIHTAAPFGAGQPGLWSSELAQIAAKVRAAPQPLIVLGDFNATADMAPFNRITKLGLTDAAVMSGNGWRMTWPADLALVPPLARIDHVLISKQLTVTAYRLGQAAGSDHRPILATLAYAE